MADWGEYWRRYGLYSSEAKVLTESFEWPPKANPRRRTQARRRSESRRRARRRLRIFERDGYRCVACGSAENLTLDHVVPLAHGGSNGAENLQTMCRSCNHAKGNLCEHD